MKSRRVLFRSALLIEIQTQGRSQAQPDQEEIALEQIIGRLSLITDFKTACDMVQNLTPTQLSAILAERESASETPEEKHKKREKEAFAKRRQEMIERSRQASQEAQQEAPQGESSGDP